MRYLDAEHEGLEFVNRNKLIFLDTQHDLCSEINGGFADLWSKNMNYPLINHHRAKNDAINLVLLLGKMVDTGKVDLKKIIESIIEKREGWKNNPSYENINDLKSLRKQLYEYGFVKPKRFNKEECCMLIKGVINKTLN